MLRCSSYSPEYGEHMKTWQKILLTIAACECWGLTNQALLFSGSTLLGSIKEPNVFGIINMLSCGFTVRICDALELISPPHSLLVPLAFLVQFCIYIVIGLILALVICRKPGKGLLLTVKSPDVSDYSRN